MGKKTEAQAKLAPSCPATMKTHYWIDTNIRSPALALRLCQEGSRLPSHGGHLAPLWRVHSGVCPFCASQFSSLCILSPKYNDLDFPLSDSYWHNRVHISILGMSALPPQHRIRGSGSGGSLAKKVNVQVGSQRPHVGGRGESRTWRHPTRHSNHSPTGRPPLPHL